MKLAQWMVAFAAAFAFGAVHAQAPQGDSKEQKKTKGAEKKKSAKSHKHKAGEKHHDENDKPKATSKAKS